MGEREVERRVAGERLSLRVCRAELLLIGRQGRAQPGLEPSVHTARLTAGGHTRESPERRCQRKKREQQKVDDELDLETTHGGCPSSLGAPLPIYPSDEVSVQREGDMSTICARVLAAALLAGAIAAALALPTLYDSAQEGRHALTAPSPSLERSVHVPALTADALPWTEGRQPGRDLQSAGLIALRSSAARSAGPGGSPSRAGGSRLVERPAAPTPQPSPTAPRPDPAAG